MTRKTSHPTSGLLPHQIAALGAQEPDDEKAFRAANATYRAIRAIEAALSMRWLRSLKPLRHTPRIFNAMKETVTQFRHFVAFGVVTTLAVGTPPAKAEVSVTGTKTHAEQVAIADLVPVLNS